MMEASDARTIQNYDWQQKKMIEYLPGALGQFCMGWTK
jgi:hypothetical protein